MTGATDDGEEAIGKPVTPKETEPRDEKPGGSNEKDYDLWWDFGREKPGSKRDA